MTMPVLLFGIAGTRIAIPLGCVERVISAVALTPLGDAPAHVLGLLDMAGKAIPVLSLRQRLGLTEPPLDPAGRFILLDLEGFAAAISVDRIEGCRELTAQEAGTAARIAIGDWTGPALTADEDGLILLEDPTGFLRGDDKVRLAAALEEAG